MQPLMQEIAEMLRDKGYTLRSGHADGADLYFESGSGDDNEIYIPWKGFNGSKSVYYGITREAYIMAEKYHPAWSKLSEAAKNLMARNCFQVLGVDLKTPVEFVVCWTPDGRISGGTGQALRIAKDYGIPVFNLQKTGAYTDLEIHVNRVRLI